MKIKLLFGLLLSCLTTIAMYGQHTVKGKVVDEATGEAMIGTNVVEKGTTNGTTTDIDGNYTLEVSSPDATLHVSFVGYQEKTIPIKGRYEINVSLIEGEEIGVVVREGYRTVKKADLTSSIEVVESKDIESVPIMSSEEVLQGKASGVFVASSTGAPGSPISVKIRGVGTPNNTDPLYVVDGMPIKDATFGQHDNPQGISFLNPSDIESIQVLKDASATAIYGTRGANGVVIITTKQGKKGEPVIGFNAYYGNQNLPEYIRHDLLSGSEFAELNIIASKNANRRPRRFNEDSIANLPTTDWQDEIFTVAPMHNLQLNLSGGTDAGNYYMSFNKFNQGGILKYSSFDRYSARLNSSYKATDWLNIGENLSINNTINQKQRNQGLGTNGVTGSPIAAAIQADPSEPVYNEEGELSYLQNTYNVANPVGILERRNYNYTTNRIQGSAFAELNFGELVNVLKGLKYKFQAGIDRSWGEYKEVWPEYEVGGNDKSLQTVLMTKREEWDNYLIENTIHYDFGIAEAHNFSILGGYTVQEEVHTWEGAASELPTSDEQMLHHGSRTSIEFLKSQSGSAKEWGLLSYLGRLSYDYNQKILFNASFRRDGSSRFGSNNRWANFPAFSLAWKISQEPFMEQYTFIDLLKVRFGWGKVGNQNIKPYAFTVDALYHPRPGSGPAIAQPYVYFGADGSNQQPVLFIDGVPNQNIKWETTQTTNIGFDINLWESKFVTTIDLYDKTTFDLLLTKPVPDYTGVNVGNLGEFITNAGEINNKGIDFSTSYRDMVNKDIDYRIGGNFSKVINEVVELEGGAPLSSGDDFPVKMIEGRPIGGFKGYVYDGLFKSQEEVESHADQTGALVGAMRFKDLNKDGVIDEKDQTIVGQALPDLLYGFNAGISYKNLDLSILTQGVYGNSIVNRVRQEALYDIKVSHNVSKDLLDYFIEGENEDTDIPKLNAIDLNKSLRSSSYFVESGSYFRIKTITLSYNLPQKWINPIQMTRARVYFTVQNLYTFTNYSGYNPEIGKSTAPGSNPLSFGIDNAVYPLPRTYIFGININM